MAKTGLHQTIGSQSHGELVFPAVNWNVILCCFTLGSRRMCQFLSLLFFLVCLFYLVLLCSIYCTLLNDFHSAGDSLALKLGCLYYNFWYRSMPKIAISFMFFSLLAFLLFTVSRTSTRKLILHAERLGSFCCRISVLLAVPTARLNLWPKS